MSAASLNRKLHRWGAILSFAPLVVVLLTGVLLLFKKDSDWIQPPTATGADAAPTLPFERILEIARSVPEAEIASWNDVDRLDVRPGKGVVKVRSHNRQEIQIDTSTGEVLQIALRRSDVIESLHDGSWFHDRAKLWIFLPSALALLGLWITGLYLWLLPHLKRRRRSLAES
jgi:uncharacterized iron-regulated membrane protein